jgi:hypothetical protein
VTVVVSVVRAVSSVATVALVIDSISVPALLASDCAAKTLTDSNTVSTIQ